MLGAPGPSRFVTTFAIVVALAFPLGASAAAGPSGRAGPDPQEQALYVLNRLGYGPKPGDVARVAAQGADAYIDQQLQPDRIAEPERLTGKLAALATLRLNPVELFREYGPPRPPLGGRPDPEAVKAARLRAQIILHELVTARLERALDSNRQLQETMTEFWFNHFNVFAPKGLVHLWVGSFEETAIRPHALGKFRDLLEATAKHPAMLFYLDNWLNVAPAGEKGINENYARELMELHTLGVDGGYSQQDVVALAHIFTGWGVPRPALRRGLPIDPSAFYFNPLQHDAADQRFLGRVIKGGGIEQGEAALDLLARSPATAHHIAFELVQYFVADKTDPAYVNAVAKRFLASDGDIRETLRTLFHDPRFWDGAGAARKFKTPYQYVMSAVRLSGATPEQPLTLQATLLQMGMPLYRYLTPEGYKNTREGWLNSDAMTKRIGLAMRLGDGLDPAKLIAAYGAPLSSRTRAAIDAAPDRLKAAVLLASPDFMTR